VEMLSDASSTLAISTTTRPGIRKVFRAVFFKMADVTPLIRLSRKRGMNSGNSTILRWTARTQDGFLSDFKKPLGYKIV